MLFNHNTGITPDSIRFAQRNQGTHNNAAALVVLGSARNASIFSALSMEKKK
jgi:hypothetical protein